MSRRKYQTENEIPHEGIEVCGVVFNLGDPDQRRAYVHGWKRTNFSKFALRLIMNDLEGVAAQPSVISNLQPPNTADLLDSTLMKGLI